MAQWRHLQADLHKQHQVLYHKIRLLQNTACPPSQYKRINIFQSFFSMTGITHLHIGNIDPTQDPCSCVNSAAPLPSNGMAVILLVSSTSDDLQICPILAVNNRFWCYLSNIATPGQIRSSLLKDKSGY